MTYRLIRQAPAGRAVRGCMRVDSKEIATLENTECIIPCGTYPVRVTFSPKFKRMLPLVLNVPGRSGIRIHRGSRPEHSTGCILVRDSDIERYLAYNMLSEQNYEDIRLEIVENN